MSDKKQLSDTDLKQMLLNIDDNYKDQSKYFIDFLNRKKHKVSLQGLIDYYNFLNDPINNLSNKTKRLYLAAAKNRIRYIFKHTPGYFDLLKRYQFQEALQKLKLFSTQSTGISRDKILTLNEVNILISHSPDWLKLMLKLLIASGLRISEMLNIKLKSIRKNGETSFIRIMGKGNKERKIEVASTLINEIQKEFEGITYLFEDKNGDLYRRETVSMTIKRLGLKVLYKNISAHTLRHTFATHMIEKTGKIKAVSDYLGHQTSSITLDMYVHQKLNKQDLLDFR